jgi:hypothetical protein
MAKKDQYILQLKRAFLFCTKFIKANWQWFILLSIVGVGAFLRFYLLSSLMHFDIDEASHVKTTYEMIINHQLIAKGPPTSNGVGLYHGAYYYYLLLIPALISKGNPIIVGGFCALLSTLAVYFLGRAVEIRYGKVSGIIAALLLAVSYETVLYGRWIWNPNLVPFFMALSLFALAKVGQKKEKYLILFSFALGSITQLHVGGFIFIPIYFLLIPLIYRVTKNKNIWILSVVAALIPWIPTLYYEFAHNFEMVRGILEMLGNKSELSFWQHITSGLNYMAFMFDNTLKLPEVTREVFICSGLIALIAQFKDWKKPESILMPAYLLLSLLFSLLIFSYYPGILYIHLSEHLFVVYAILATFLLQILFQHKETIIVSLLVIVFVLQENLLLFKTDIVDGDRQYETEKKICQVIKDQSQNNIEIVVNGKTDPVYITYVCQNRFGINSGKEAKITFNSDLRDSFGYSIEKYLPPLSEHK